MNDIVTSKIIVAHVATIVLVIVMSPMRALSTSTNGVAMIGSAGSWMWEIGEPRNPRPNAFPIAPPATDITSATTTNSKIALDTL
jgi:hypothetical protein